MCSVYSVVLPLFRQRRELGAVLDQHVSQHILTVQVPTLTFDDLLDACDCQSLDILQIDAEGLDAQLLGWFPFGRLKPALLHYEIAHMTEPEHAGTTARLQALGYAVMSGDSTTDQMAILL